MSENELDLNKIDKEITKSQPKEKAEHVSPIQIEPKKGETQEMAEDKLRDELVARFNDWDIKRQPRQSLWEELYRKYFTVIEKTKVPTRSNITQPIAYQVIEAALPKVVNSIFSQENKFFDVVTIDPDNIDERARALAIKRLLDIQLEKTDFFQKFVEFTKQMLLYGTSFFKVYWDVEREWVWERIPERKVQTSNGFVIGETIEWKEEKSYKVVKRQPGLDLIDILDLYIDPDATDVQCGKGVFIRSWTSKDALKELGQGRFPVYGNVDKLDQTGSSAETYQESRSNRFASRGISTLTRDRKKEVELLEFWGKMDLDGDGIKEEVNIVIADRQVIIKAQANPYHHQKRPIIRGVFSPVPLEFYGLGLIQPVLSQIDEMNTLKRQRLDNINQSLNAMWQVDPAADVELDTLISAPNQIILSSPLDAVKKLDTPDVTQSAFTEAGLVQQDIERATAPAAIQGAPASGRLGRTARGAAMIIGQALEKFNMSTKLIEERVLRPILEYFYKLDLQFIDTDDVLQNPLLYQEIADMRLTPEDIRANVRFKLVGISELVNSEAKINQMISYMSIFGKVLAPESIAYIAQQTWKQMGFPAEAIEVFQGQQVPPGTENTVDPSMSNAVIGQATNQGISGAPPSVPQQ